jgi:uncharacterized RDD family membrane protein YckC
MIMDTNMDVDAQIAPEKNITVYGFGRRLAATLIDAVLVFFISFILVFIVSIVFGMIGFSEYFSEENNINMSALILASAGLVSLVYYIGSWSRSGQTIGHNLLGIRVVNDEGEIISIGKGILRYIGFFISGLVLSIGFLWIEFDKKRQGWHDKLAGTYVIYVDQSFNKDDKVIFKPSDPGKTWIWVALWIILAIVQPTLLISGLLLLGPIASRTFVRLLDIFQ